MLVQAADSMRLINNLEDNYLSLRGLFYEQAPLLEVLGMHGSAGGITGHSAALFMPDLEIKASLPWLAVIKSYQTFWFSYFIQLEAFISGS